jgi:hypothetical protein
MPAFVGRHLLTAAKISRRRVCRSVNRLGIPFFPRIHARRINLIGFTSVIVAISVWGEAARRAGRRWPVTALTCW